MSPPAANALAGLALAALLPTASAASAQTAQSVDTAGYWLGFVLVFIISAAEALASFLWTRIRVTSDGVHPCELSARVCGREIIFNTVDPAAAHEIAKDGLPAGFHSGTYSSVTQTGGGYTVSRESADGCSTCGGFESRRMNAYGCTTEAVIDKYGSLMLISTLIIRRFSPAVPLGAPTGLLKNIKELAKAPDGIKRDTGRIVEHAVHLFVGLLDISLGIAGLALNPASPENLYLTLKDVEAPMTFENYLTLFLLYWILGAALLVCLLPLSSKRRSVQMFGWPGAVAFGVASLANVALFGVGCWKMDHARRHNLPWTPMLSYWIGGAGAISFPLFGIEIFHTFGFVGLIFMLKHMF